MRQGMRRAMAPGRVAVLDGPQASLGLAVAYRTFTFHFPEKIPPEKKYQTRRQSWRCVGSWESGSVGWSPGLPQGLATSRPKQTLIDQLVPTATLLYWTVPKHSGRREEYQC